MPRSDRSFGGVASALLLTVAAGILLTGCGTFSGLLKSDGAGTLSATPETPAATAAVTTPDATAPAPPVAMPAPAEGGAAGLDASPTALTRAADPDPEPAPRRSDEEEEASALAQQKSDADALEEDYDPWEGFNEKMFSFNRNLDKYVLKPAARAYRFVMPEPWQVLIANGFDNINFIPRMINSLLQGKWGGAGRELGRFLINSTAGIGGLFDPAKDYWGIPKSREDFGQTLAVWGAKAGPYLILPFMEPMTVRDGIGKAVDGAMQPLSYVLPFVWDRIGMKAGDTLNDRALNYDLFQGFEESVIDMYSAVRHGYLQRRQQLIKE
ncbi:MAG TPA: VacJ family lipoprotein [Candidatus Binatia bacterium]|nr:VacJ family lipoprotein [Candidatus Binatia bacterium]